MMSKNTGKQYESLTQRMFQAILEQDGVRNVSVQQDVELEGRTATHQIDVFWEFEQAGIRHQVVVQCKDWNAKVKQEQVFSLYAVLNDLPGQPRGVVVSKAGFQNGAREYAVAHGIILYELRAPTDADWEGFIQEIHIELQMLAPVVHDFKLLLDEPWTAAEKVRLGLGAEPLPIKFNGLAGELVFVRDDGSPITTAAEIVRLMVPSSVGVRERCRHNFTEPAYFHLEHPNFIRAKILGVDVDVEQTVAMTNVIQVNVNECVRFILKNVADGTFRTLDAQGRPLTPENSGDK
jgi:Restriction endonuclease